MTIWWLAIDRNHGYCSYTEQKTRQVVAQGWPLLGNLAEQINFRYSLREDDFKEAIQRIGDKGYSGHNWWKDNDRQLRIVPRIFWNLFSLQIGDLVIAIEGCSVCGICQIPERGMDSYTFDERYKYAHGFGGLVQWIDWDENKFGNPPTAPGQSVQGIARLVKEADYVKQAWRRYQQGQTV